MLHPRARSSPLGHQRTDTRYQPAGCRAAEEFNAAIAEAGFWEPQNLWLLHDRMFREAGSRWDDWRKLDLGILPPERLDFYKSEIRRLIEEEFGDAPLFVLKDPRICRFVPLYQDILGDIGIDVKYVLIHRHPRAVEASLKVRNGMPEACSQLLWLRYVLEGGEDNTGHA